jgi:anti-anti-sigma factor
MFITERKVHGCKIIELNGSVDASTESFEDDLRELIEEETKIVIDCKNLSYINSNGLRIFLSIFKDVAKVGARIVISSLQGNVKELFLLTGFLELFETSDSQQDALKLLA